MDKTILAEGYWCVRCEYFESGDDFEGGRCMSCGCPIIDHSAAQVVAR